MRATTTLCLLILVPCLGACELDFQLGDLPNPDEGEPGAECAPDAGSGPPPVLTLVGPATQPHECATVYIDPGATASDVCFGDLSRSITRTGEVDTHAPGSYPLTYNVSNPAGQSATPVTRTVNVQDTQPPVITPSGPLNVSLECGSPYTDPGATASDACAGALPAVPISVPDPNTPGSYSLRYRATDPSGNTALSTTARTVVVADTLAPTITVNGPVNQQFECGGAYVDPGATANDVCAGTVAVTATRSGSSTAPGTFTITYSATDPSGNTVTSPVTRTVQVNDNRPPVLTLVGSATQVQECARPYTDPGATALDECAGELPAVPTGAPNPRTPGNYIFGYQATDPSGNTATSRDRRTVMVQDTIPPTLTLNGPLNMTIECGSIFEDPGATATDICAGDLPVVATGAVNSNAPGTYVIAYSVADSSGNTTASARPRVVQVIDTLAPVLQVLPGPSVIECNGPPYVDPGATAFDECAGDLTQAITVTGNVDHTRAGQYTITYDVTDPSGYTAAATRSITVGPCSLCFSLALSDSNLLLLEDSGAVHSVQGRVEAGGERVADRFVELRSLSWRLSRLAAHGETTREARGGLSLKGTDPELNVFEVEAQALTRETQLSIDAPAGSRVVLNVHGDAVVLEGLRHTFSGGIDSQDILYNFVEATSIRAEGTALEGTVLAPYARIDFNDGSWKGGLYAVSLMGNAQGYVSPLRDRTICP